MMNNEATNRQLDVWSIYRDPEHVLDALKIILEHKGEITDENPLTLFTNCVSKFTINGEEVDRYIDTLICSREADIALCLTSARYTDKELGDISATPEDIAKFLDKYNIPYKIVTGKSPEKEIGWYKQGEDKITVIDVIEKDDRNIPELWMAREEEVIRLALEESASKGCRKCVFYPNIPSNLGMGYYLEDSSYKEVWGIDFKGLVETDNNWTLIIDEGYKDNLNEEDVIAAIKNLRDSDGNKIDFTYDVNKNGIPKELNDIEKNDGR